ncbi:MAG: hypothetical protein J2P21_21725 [Chloracidobacterium sp.]|nr:hypothetical protein [Chloracidobacterium sp.]
MIASNLIRSLTSKDISKVSALYRKVHLAGDAWRFKPSPQKLGEAFDEIFLRNPSRDENLPSLVCEDEGGAIVGFIGVSPRRMSLKGRPILVAVSAHLMLDPDRQSRLAGVQLLRRFFSGPQQLSLTDFANDIGRKVWNGIGGRMSHIHCLNWVKTLRPSSRALSLVAGKLRIPGPLRSITRPLVRLTDAALARMSPHRYRFAPSDLIAKDLDDETLLECISRFSASYSLRPEYDELTLPWLIRRAEGVKSSGNLRKVALYDDAGVIVGWYLYYLNPGGASQVLQMCTRKGFSGAVLDHLFHHAWSNGSESISGRLDAESLPELSSRACYMNCGPPWVLIHTRDPEISQAFERGDVFLSKLEGEWCTSYRM